MGVSRKVYDCHENGKRADRPGERPWGQREVAFPLGRPRAPPDLMGPRDPIVGRFADGSGRIHQASVFATIGGKSSAAAQRPRAVAVSVEPICPLGESIIVTVCAIKH